MDTLLTGYARSARYELWKLDAIRFRGTRFSCPVCGGRYSRMKPFVGRCSIKGLEVDCYTQNAICPRCHSDIRQRFILQFLLTKTDIFTRRQSVLHFAPELGIYKHLISANLDYVCADLEPKRFANAVKADMTNIPFADSRFDHILCIHVLEHIVDDRKAMAELFRVLAPGGSATIAVPTYGDNTFELAGLTYEERNQQYGTGDHVRLNGLDFADKLRATGFIVETISIDDVPGDYVDRTVVSPHTESDRYLFGCRKPE